MGLPPMMPLDDALAGVTAVGFDTSPIIYLIEANPKYDILITEIFQRSNLQNSARWGRATGT